VHNIVNAALGYCTLDGQLSTRGHFSSLQIWLLFAGASITYNSRFVPRMVLCKLINPGYWCRRVLKLLFSFRVHIPRIVSPYPVFRVQLLELHTGVVSGIHTTSYQRWWLEQAQSVATAITQRDTLVDFRPFGILHHLHYIDISAHYINLYILLHKWEGSTGKYSVRGWQYWSNRREGQYRSRESNILLYCLT